MPAVYDLVKDYNSPDTAISMAPIWVLAVVRWAHPFVFDRATLKSATGLDAFQQASKPVIISSDCTSLDISANKGAHVVNLTASLRDNNVNYLSTIFPDDWLFAWILPNETRAKALLKKLRSGKACNGFYDGLKFVGRVQSIFKDTVVDDLGKPQSAFALNGAGFSEFDYTLFWEPLLVDNASLPTWFARLGLALNNIITGSDKSVTSEADPHAIDVNKMIPALVRLCLGEGPFQQGNLSVPGGANASPNGGVRVPGLVGQLLGMTDTSEMTYSDMVDIVVGVQKYRGAAGAPQNSPLIFNPDGLKTTSVELANPGEPFNAASDLQNIFVASPKKNFVEVEQPTVAKYQTTGVPLLGEFPLVQLPFQDTPIWQIMGQFLNPGVNEMYVALKPNQDGNVFPRLTVRQYPFSTSKFEATFVGPTLTTFLELPRWRVDPKMLKRVRVGRSNALRANFWHIQGTGPGTAISKELQYVRSPPNTDRSDIERSGLRPVKRTVNCLIKDATQGPDLWRDIITDITAGQQLALSGTMVVTGLISPVAPGDNLQFANVVYHIESVHHVCSMGADGRRTWQTNLQLSHGMADETTLATNQDDSGLDAPLEDFAGVRNADPATVHEGRSVLDLFEEDV
jgi:hypothetical protein